LPTHEWVVVVVFLILAGVIFSQATMTAYFRYLAVCIPFALILSVRILMRVAEFRWLRYWAYFVVVATVSEATSSINYSIGYSNMLFGGAWNGYRYYFATADYGQSLETIAKWHRTVPQQEAVFLSYFYWMRLENAEVTSVRPIPPLGEIRATSTPDAQGTTLEPGYYVVNYAESRLADRFSGYSYLRPFKPVAELAPSLLVFHLTKEDCQQVAALIHEAASRESSRLTPSAQE
jgi:hypothetical protein